MSAWCVCAKIWNISTLLRGIGICLHCFSPLMLLYFNFCDVVGNLIEGLYSVNVFVEVSVWPFERHCNFIAYIWCINMTCTTDGKLIALIWFVHVVAKNLWSMPHLKLRGWVELYVWLDFDTSCELLYSCVFITLSHCYMIQNSLWISYNLRCRYSIISNDLVNMFKALRWNGDFHLHYFLTPSQPLSLTVTSGRFQICA